MDDDADNTNGMYNNNKRRFMDDEIIEDWRVWRRSGEVKRRVATEKNRLRIPISTTLLHRRFSIIRLTCFNFICVTI